MPTVTRTSGSEHVCEKSQQPPAPSPLTLAYTKHTFGQSLGTNLPAPLAAKTAALTLEYQQAKRQGFQAYIRRGTPPAIPAALQQQLASHFHDLLQHKQASAVIDDEEEDALLRIIDLAEHSQSFMAAIAAAHKADLLALLQNSSAPVRALPATEPYLNALFLEGQWQYLRRLERVLADIEAITDSPATKSFDPNAGLGSQVEQRLLTEHNRARQRLNQQLDKHRQQALGITSYIWRSKDDGKVRSAHQANDDQRFGWDSPPPGGHPGEAFGCRCYAEPVLDDFGPPVVVRPEEVQVAGLPLVLAVIAASAKVVNTANKLRKLRKVSKVKPGKKLPRGRIFRRPKGMPKDWEKVPSRKGKGVKFLKPGSKRQTYVRIMKGNKNSKNTWQQENYVVMHRGNGAIDKFGNRVSSKSEAAHIPLKEFSFKVELFK